MLNVKILMLLLLFSSCVENNKVNKVQVKQHDKYQTKDATQEISTYYFSDALTYELNENGEKSEIWFYVNPETKQILYVPNDDMIKGVVSFPDGTYKIFGSTEFNGDTVLSESILEVLNEDNFAGVAKLINSTKVIDQTNIQQKAINCQGYRIDYEQMEGGETIYVTEEIPINSRQVYGFCRLNGDARLNSIFDYLNVLNQKQTITHIEQNKFSLRLINFGPNPYELVVK